MFRRCHRAFSTSAVAVARTVTDEELLAHLNLSTHHVKAFPLNPKARAWAVVNNAARSHFQGLISTSPHEPLLPLRSNLKDVKAPTPVRAKTLLEEWGSKTFADIRSLVTYYESVVAPALAINAVLDGLKLESYGLKDSLKLKKESAEILDKKKRRLQDVEAELTKLTRQRDEYVASALDTSTYNNIINILRLCGEKDDHAFVYVIRVLDDMTALHVKFDLTTQLLLKNVCFGDEPGEDSDVLFAFVEYPEMGDISLRTDTVDVACDRALAIASERCYVPLTEGPHIKNPDTHPMLERLKDDDSDQT